MPEIKTFVYFDLEATGLKNAGKPRITELSLVAVNQQDVLGKIKFFSFQTALIFNDFFITVMTKRFGSQYFHIDSSLFDHDSLYF